MRKLEPELKLQVGTGRWRENLSQEPAEARPITCFDNQAVSMAQMRTESWWRDEVTHREL